ncbi:hypothetical protein LTR85_012089 [Meristemomyces frigidus]|nr:hypothetical protein LTR85_012089 [Meristemomyces frigidus]
MSDLKRELTQAQARLTNARKRWNDAVEECTAFDAAAVAARHLESTLRSTKGKKTKKHADEMLKAKSNLEMAAAAFEDSEAQVKSTEQALATAKAAVAQAKRRYDMYIAAEQERIEAAKWRAVEAEINRKRRMREQARQRRAESEQRRHEQQKPKDEENGKRKREEESERPEVPRVPKMPKVAPARDITAKEKQDLLEACSVAFANKSRMRNFPEPPIQPCRNGGCVAAKEGRALKACQCNIRAVFAGRTTLKSDRLMFNPDKFSSCADDLRALMQQKAKEVFVVVDAMWAAVAAARHQREAC